MILAFSGNAELYSKPKWDIRSAESSLFPRQLDKYELSYQMLDQRADVESPPFIEALAFMKDIMKDFMKDIFREFYDLDTYMHTIYIL